MLDLAAGVFVGFGLAGCSFSVVLAAFGKLLPERWRLLAFGAGTAAGSFGQFLYSPLAVSLMDAFGWQTALVSFGVGMLLVLPLSLAVATAPAEASHGAASQSLRQALSEALGHRSYVLLVLGFFTCGFQLAFITIHMPAYLVDRGLSAQVGGWTIAVIGLFNIVGSLASGWLGNLMPKRYILRGARLHLVSGDGAVFDPVRRGHGPALALDGRADQRHHRVDIRHALARDARGLGLLQPSGRGLPRRVARRRRVRAHRLL
jgi:cyanate permease